MEKAKLSPRQEDYIEAIFHLSEKHRVARSRDISVRLGVNKSSVTGALQGLANKGVINYSPYDVITLTEKGLQLAVTVVERHTVFRNFLERVLGINSRQADEAACRLEHSVSGEITERLAEFIKFFEKCPSGGVTWKEGGGFKCRHAGDRHDCERCGAGS